MPCVYSHNLAAKAVRARVGDGLLFDEDAAFLMGAQGPDPFFFLRAWPPDAAKGSLIGGRLHTGDTRALFARLTEQAVTRKLRAFTAGFMCHYALDTRAHPYIIASTCHKHHTPFETQLDAAFLEYRGEAPAPAVSLIPWDAAAAAEADAALAPFGEPGLFYKGFRQMRLAMRALYDPKGIKSRFLGEAGGYFFRPPCEYAPDILDLAHSPWWPP